MTVAKTGLTRGQIDTLYLPPTDDFVTIDVPEMRYLMIDGKGSPERAPFAKAIQWIYAVLHPMKRVAREKMGRHYLEPPLEALWWADDPADFVAGRKNKLYWRLMISATPDWITKQLFTAAVADAAKRLGNPPKTLRLDRYREGKSVQIMFRGHPSEQRPTMTRLHTEILPARRLVPNGPHHEIYLTDSRRVAPASQKTVLRQPVKSATIPRRKSPRTPDAST